MKFNPKPFIIFIQETHCASENECSTWKSEWKGKSFWTVKNTNSIGTAILINEKDHIEVIKSETDTEGRWNKLLVKVANQSYQLINIYAPNKGGERKNFIKNICHKITEGNHPIIMGGDFNCTLGKKDRRPTMIRGEEGRKELHNLLNPLTTTASKTAAYCHPPSLRQRQKRPPKVKNNKQIWTPF